mmetsp:Transcript_11358/g.18600  ORF Transcript_11358/g.18600 Transcript_11358/m.18600 type:complete len:150 (-) Transcript_11358:658-1107(-)
MKRKAEESEIQTPVKESIKRKNTDGWTPRCPLVYKQKFIRNYCIAAMLDVVTPSGPDLERIFEHAEFYRTKNIPKGQVVMVVSPSNPDAGLLDSYGFAAAIPPELKSFVKVFSSREELAEFLNSFDATINHVEMSRNDTLIPSSGPTAE